MGMRKRWSRLILVNGVFFRYHVAEERDGAGLHVCIQQVEPPGQRLLSGFRKPMQCADVGLGHRFGTVLPYAVTPRVIRLLILVALQRGWRPAQTGLGQFHLPGHEVVSELPNPAE